MKYHDSRHIGLVGCLLLLLLGCEKSPEPQKIGVFASTNRGLLELTSYGEQSRYSMASYNFRKLPEVPTVSKVISFYVNMPDSKITNSKVFWVTGLGKDFDEESQVPLNTSIETTKNNVYRITCADLDGKKGGYILLKVSMPLGTADRMYVIQLT